MTADVVIDGKEDEESNSSSDDELLDINFWNFSQHALYNGSGCRLMAGGQGVGGGWASTTAGGQGGGGGWALTTAGGRGGGGV